MASEMGGSEAWQFAQHSLLLFFFKKNTKLVYEGLESSFLHYIPMSRGTLLNVMFGKSIQNFKDHTT